jgi:hypothetical protein
VIAPGRYTLLMAIRGARVWVIAGISVALLVCVGCPVADALGLTREPTHSDRYATVGDYFNPIAYLGPCASTKHYIQVGGKVYHYHDGMPPGYLIVPELNAMIFATSQRPYGRGQNTIHIRDLGTGTVTDVDAGSYAPAFIKRGGHEGRWWVHERSGQRITFCLFTARDSTSLLEFATIDLTLRRVVDEQSFQYDASGNLLDVHNKPSPPAPGQSLDELIGTHRAEAGLPARTDH